MNDRNLSSVVMACMIAHVGAQGSGWGESAQFSTFNIPEGY